MAFHASTNPVLELGVILWALMGWQFTLAEFVSGPIMIALLVLLLRRAIMPARLAEARAKAALTAANLTSRFLRAKLLYINGIGLLLVTTGA